MSNKDDQITEEEIMEIVAIFIESAKAAGKEIQIATLFHGDDSKVLVDNRKDTDLN